MSTTVQRFLEADLPNSWSIFEPCHTCDRTSYGHLMNDSPPLAKCIEDVLRCNFSRFEAHWQLESPERARDCANPQHEWRVFKTVTVHNLGTMVIPQLMADPSLHVILIERDPRGIYASMKEANFRHASSIGYLCQAMVKSLNVTHERLHRIRFDWLAARPSAALGALLARLGARLSPAGEAWISQNFDVGCDVKPNLRSSAGTYKLCQNSSKSHVDTWRHELSHSEKEEYLVNPQCQVLEAARSFGNASRHLPLLLGKSPSRMPVPHGGCPQVLDEGAGGAASQAKASEA